MVPRRDFYFFLPDNLRQSRPRPHTDFMRDRPARKAHHAKAVGQQPFQFQVLPLLRNP